MRSAAVVLTYPAHFLHTAGTIKSIRQHHPEIRSYSAIIDDLSNIAWQDYPNDAEKFYGDLNCRVIRTSSLPFLQSITRPWVRQQTVKLYLDQLLDIENWFFCDGDCVLLAPWPDETISAHPVLWGETGAGFCRYVGFMLGLPNWQGFRNAQNCYVTTSAPPTRDMQGRKLQSLRQYVRERHGYEIWEIHRDHQRDAGFLPSEWELMDCFAAQIQQHTLVMNNYRHLVEMSWSADHTLGIKFWRDQDIMISDELWDKLPLVRYL